MRHGGSHWETRLWSDVENSFSPSGSRRDGKHASPHVCQTEDLSHFQLQKSYHNILLTRLWVIYSYSTFTSGTMEASEARQDPEEEETQEEQVVRLRRTQKQNTPTHEWSVYGLSDKSTEGNLASINPLSSLVPQINRLNAGNKTRTKLSFLQILENSQEAGRGCHTPAKLNIQFC